MITHESSRFATKQPEKRKFDVSLVTQPFDGSMIDGYHQ